jgi:hypothetical protein
MSARTNVVEGPSVSAAARTRAKRAPAGAFLTEYGNSSPGAETVPARRVYASGSGSVLDRNGWLQTVQRMGPAAQLAQEVRILSGQGAFRR